MKRQEHLKNMGCEVWPGFIYFGIWSRIGSFEVGYSHSIHSYGIRLQCVLILFFAAQPVWNATVYFAWVCVIVKLKLSLCIPWRQMEECRCSATGSLILTQEGDTQWVSHPGCFTQGKMCQYPFNREKDRPFRKLKISCPCHKLNHISLVGCSRFSVTKM
jgi:hypothetical protein